MALLPDIVFVNESGGGVLMEIPGTYSKPAVGETVWLGEDLGSLTEYKIEKIEHKYTSKDLTNPQTSRVIASINGYITITVSVVI